MVALVAAAAVVVAAAVVIATAISMVVAMVLALVVPGVDVVLVAAPLARAVLRLGRAVLASAAAAGGEYSAGAGRHQRKRQHGRDASCSHASLPSRELGFVARSYEERRRFLIRLTRRRSPAGRASRARARGR